MHLGPLRRHTLHLAEPSQRLRVVALGAMTDSVGPSAAEETPASARASSTTIVPSSVRLSLTVARLVSPPRVDLGLTVARMVSPVI